MTEQSNKELGHSWCKVEPKNTTSSNAMKNILFQVLKKFKTSSKNIKITFKPKKIKNIFERIFAIRLKKNL
ncbi:MAG: hypothetical protein CM15mP13_3220 [Pseudomonadota bacterium]|nr:MAG: hypothetical protein CM15mP13_3220 [Pseudomonadota bacterium]